MSNHFKPHPTARGWMIATAPKPRADKDRAAVQKMANSHDEIKELLLELKNTVATQGREIDDLAKQLDELKNKDA